MIVADTSLIASLLIPGPATPAALAVLEMDPHWTAPALWRYEFKNVLATQMRVLGLPVDQALALFEMAQVIIAEPEIEAEPGAILRLAHSKRLSAYDAEFLALAHTLKVKAVTFDKGILNADPEAAISPDAFASSRGNSEL